MNICEWMSGRLCDRPAHKARCKYCVDEVEEYEREHKVVVWEKIRLCTRPGTRGPKDGDDFCTYIAD